MKKETINDLIEFAKDFRLFSGIIVGIIGGIFFGWEVFLLGLGVFIISTIVIFILKHA